MANPPDTSVFGGAGNSIYSSPPGALYLIIKMVGGGGGGGGGGDVNPGTDGSPGGQTIFGLPGQTVIANGGQGGFHAQTYGGDGGIGGLPSTNLGSILNLKGGDGTAGSGQVQDLTTNPAGGTGGSSVFGGNGGGGLGKGHDASPNTGSGGGGGAGNGAFKVNAGAGGGGGAGAYVEHQINLGTTSISYPLTVGDGGSGGNAGGGVYSCAGGKGGSGIIIITAYYQ